MLLSEKKIWSVPPLTWVAPCERPHSALTGSLLVAQLIIFRPFLRPNQSLPNLSLLLRCERFVLKLVTLLSIFSGLRHDRIAVLQRMPQDKARAGTNRLHKGDGA